MKSLKQLLAILMTAIMILTGTSLGGVGALSFAADDQDDAAVSQELQTESENGTGAEQGESNAPVFDDSNLVHKTLKVNKVKLDGMMPEGAKVTATDAFSTKAVRKLDAGEGTALAAYDITIKADGEEYQPNSDHPIQVQISDGAIKEDSNLTIWHIKDDGTKEQVDDFTVSDGKVQFEAVGFSVYAIIELPEPAESQSEIVADLSELAGHVDDTDFCLSYSVVNYMTSGINDSHAFIVTTAGSEAARWRFESAGDENTYYIYTQDDNTKNYIHVIAPANQNNNDVELSTTDKTAFEVSSPSGGKFYLKVKNYEKYLQYSNSGGGVRTYKNNSDANNSRFTITYADSLVIDEDPYGIDGKSYGIISFDDQSVYANVLDAEGNAGSLQASQLPTLDMQYHNKIKFVKKDDTITMWEFDWIEGTGSYYLKSGDKYLAINGNNNLSVVDSQEAASSISIYSGSDSNAGKYRFTNGSYSICISENGETFSAVSGAGSRTWLYLVDESSLEENEYLVYTAKKVSVASEEVTTGTEVIVYTRIWNDGKYEFYLIECDGTMRRIYESGENLQWTANAINTALWEFTEYHYDENADPPVSNGYFELKNSYTGDCLRPQLNDDVLTSDPDYMKRSVNLDGRMNGEDCTTILSWEDAAYSYRGLKVVEENGVKRVVSCPEEESDQFYFATMKETVKLDEVETVDNNLYGINIKMSDYSYDGDWAGGSYREKTQYDFLGLDTNRAGLVESMLGEDGYPISAVQGANRFGESMADLFSNSGPKTTTTTANHLFPKSVYEESGYFEYKSTQNFASLQGNNFKVYNQLGTTEARVSNTMRHGLFFPYNDIDGKLYSKQLLNITDISGNELPDSSPRKGERLFNIPGKYPSAAGQTSVGELNYFFGMELDAGFTQTPSGKDDWGHDIIFEFTGDDDMWFFVDDILVLDMGGVHSAMSGSVNFKTGVVTGNRTEGRDNLRAIFKAAFIENGDTEAEAEAKLADLFRQNEDGQWVFKNYSSHTMKMFYMERGAGSSNLYMRMNLAAVKPGHVMLGKEVSGADSGSLTGIEYPFEIYYKQTEDAEETKVTPSTEGVTVFYKGTDDPVPYVTDETDPNYGRYLLNPGRPVDIGFPDAIHSYRIAECDVDGDLYDNILINEEPNPVTADSHPTVSTTSTSISDRPIVVFDNHVRNGALRTLKVKKVLLNESGQEISDDPTNFDFRLSLGGPDDDIASLTRANMQPYYIVSPDGYYCRWDDDQQKFVKTSYPDGDVGFDEMMADIEDHTAGFTIGKVRFVTSANGAISKIPAGHSFEVRDLLFGTKYSVDEESNEIPVGYRFDNVSRTVKETGRADVTTPDMNNGEILANQDHIVTVTNKRGWGLLVNKVWSDEVFVSAHEDIYIAVFKKPGSTDPELINGTVRRINQQNTTRYFFESISGNFSDYYVYEVKLGGSKGTDYTVGSDGTVTLVTSAATVTPIIDESVNIHAKPIGKDTYEEFTYTPEYTKGVAESTYAQDPTEEQKNIRTDTVTNIRSGGIKIINTDKTGSNPLQYAEFKLVKNNGSGGTTIGSYISNENGLITNAYLTEGKIGTVELGEGTYTLTETKSPAGYRALIGDITITVEKIEESSGDISYKYYIDGDASTHYGTGYSYVTSGTLPILTVNNEPFTLKVIKTGVNNRPLQGAKFDLYREVMSVSGPVKDYTPIKTDLTTASDGVIPQADQNLSVGSYFLTETLAPSGYEQLGSDVKFTISPRGEVILNSGETAEKLEPYSDIDGYHNTIRIANTPNGDVAPTGYSSYILPFLLILTGGLLLGVMLLYSRRRRSLEE